MEAYFESYLQRAALEGYIEETTTESEILIMDPRVMTIVVLVASGSIAVLIAIFYPRIRNRVPE
jgi:hypothetical protein